MRGQVGIAHAGIAAGAGVIFATPGGNGRPKGVGHQMPALSFVLAEKVGVFKVEEGMGIPQRQRVGPAVSNAVHVFGEIDDLFYPAV